MTRAEVEQYIRTAVDHAFAARQVKSVVPKPISKADAALNRLVDFEIQRANAVDTGHQATYLAKRQREALRADLIEAATGERPFWSHLVG